MFGFIRRVFDKAPTPIDEKPTPLNSRLDQLSFMFESNGGFTVTTARGVTSYIDREDLRNWRIAYERPWAGSKGHDFQFNLSRLSFLQSLNAYMTAHFER